MHTSSLQGVLEYCSPYLEVIVPPFLSESVKIRDNLRSRSTETARRNFCNIRRLSKLQFAAYAVVQHFSYAFEKNLHEI